MVLMGLLLKWVSNSTETSAKPNQTKQQNKTELCRRRHCHHFGDNEDSVGDDGFLPEQM